MRYWSFIAVHHRCVERVVASTFLDVHGLGRTRDRARVNRAKSFVYVFRVCHQTAA